MRLLAVFNGALVILYGIDTSNDKYKWNIQCDLCSVQLNVITTAYSRIIGEAFQIFNNSELGRVCIINKK